MLERNESVDISIILLYKRAEVLLKDESEAHQHGGEKKTL